MKITIKGSRPFLVVSSGIWGNDQFILVGIWRILSPKKVNAIQNHIARRWWISWNEETQLVNKNHFSEELDAEILNISSIDVANSWHGAWLGPRQSLAM